MAVVTRRFSREGSALPSDGLPFHVGIRVDSRVRTARRPSTTRAQSNVAGVPDHRAGETHLACAPPTSWASGVQKVHEGSVEFISMADVAAVRCAGENCELAVRDRCMCSGAGPQERHDRVAIAVYDECGDGYAG